MADGGNETGRVPDEPAAPPRLGLGLYIVQQVVHAHGGRIDVRSSETEGTVFDVELPRVALRGPQTRQVEAP